MSLNKENTTQKKHLYFMNRQDFILLIIFFLLILCLFIAYRLFFRNEGSRVIVSVDSVFQAEYPLQTDLIIEIKGIQGTNLLVIEGGFASVKSASCPDRICVHHRKISHPGESIVCLPNRVVVSIADDDTMEPIDAISQ